MVWVCMNVWQPSMMDWRMNFRSFIIFYYEIIHLRWLFIRFGPTRAMDSDSCSHYWQSSALASFHWASPSTGIATGGWWSRSNNAPLRRRRRSLWLTTIRWDHCNLQSIMIPLQGLHTTRYVKTVYRQLHEEADMVVPVTGGPGFRMIRDFRFVVQKIGQFPSFLPLSGGLVARKTDIFGMHKRLLSLRY